MNTKTSLWSRFWSRGAKTPDHARYLRHQRTQTFWVFATQLLILIACLAFWEVGARLNWINPFIFSYPSKIWLQFLAMLGDGSLLHHTWITVYETLVGFLLGTFAGTVLAIVIWASPFLARVLDPYIVIFNSMPKVALGPIFIVAFGQGFLSILMMALAISVVITTIVVYTAFRDVDPNLLKLVRTYGGSRRHVFQKVVFPASLPAILSTLKVNVGLSWIGVIVGEFLVAQAGLGYLIIYGFQVFNFTLVMLALFVILIVSTVMYHAVAFFEKRTLKWKD
ncbi:ABC transporter permease [Tumebacillus permanentifrigoris]|uniref:NitT/TauT family transport system permease protein n=1 Tax=Tumebacillus permanentifrigoris TaxID=378543 RepID=A0A316DZ94_9BACL|nr:ABC transporter permease [Tumebacillus permanentifrigoris]PWK15830.1 NitT/TauT family transport system permease protein [Tumebacillus permanentifrigoris]